MGGINQARRSGSVLRRARRTRPLVCESRCRHSGGLRAEPHDLIPDFIPILGQVDDLLIVPAGIFLAVKLIPREIMAEHRAAAFQAESQPSSRAAAAVIIAILIAAAALLIWAFWPTAAR